MDLQLWFSYLVIEFLIGITPGPAVITVVNQSLKYGSKNGVYSILGISVVNVNYFLLAAFGLWAFLLQFPRLVNYIQYVGASVIIGMGVFLFFVKTKPDLLLNIPKKTFHSFKAGLFAQLSNPKGLYFFILVLPQFIDFKKDYKTQILILCLTSIAIEFIVLLLYILFSSRGREYIKNKATFFYYLDRITGLSLIISGIFFLYQFLKSSG